MKKKFLILIIINALIFTLVFSSGANPTQASEVNEKPITFELDNEEFTVTVEKENSNDISFILENENIKDNVHVVYSTGDITVTSADGTSKTYNLKDFETNEEPEVVQSEEANGVPIEQLEPKNGASILSTKTNTSLLAATSSASYISDINASLGFGSSATWESKGSYTYGGKAVYVYEGTYWKYTEALKKYNFSASTAISVILGVIVAIGASGFTVPTVISILTSLGVTVVSEKIAYAISPSIGVKQKQIGRGFYVHGKGYTLKTKKWYNYLEVVHEGKVKLEQYSSDDYAYWYNNYSDKHVAEVAYQQYRYIEGLRGDPPHKSEFSWS
ncbi:hypothetical protein [Rummeliibacillus pycnus]|uniref:hypothetical protein n=1 Tax=Rummeliibacillus pycnus TaxID=101070 RepID=UPI0037CC59E5